MSIGTRQQSGGGGGAARRDGPVAVPAQVSGYARAMTVPWADGAGGAPPRRAGLKEPFSALSHAVGALLSLVALIALCSAARGTGWRGAGLVLFGGSLLLLYTASALYHGLHVPPKRQAVLRRLDHAAIFLLIAGTFAPICLGPLYGPWGWGLLGAEGGMALAGVLFSVMAPGGRRPADVARITLYLVMGWAICAAARPLYIGVPPVAGALLVAGGLTYTAGAVVFAMDRPHLWPGRFSAHDLWHLFVLAGSACHFVAVWFYLAPRLSPPAVAVAAPVVAAAPVAVVTAFGQGGRQ